MTLLSTLGVITEQVAAQKTILTLPVTDKVRQPYGLVHGGVNAVLAETAASLAANAFLPDNQVAVGVDLTTHHLRPVTAGTLTATAVPVSLGHQLQVYTVTIRDEAQQTTSISTVTTMAKLRP